MIHMCESQISPIEKTLLKSQPLCFSSGISFPILICVFSPKGLHINKQVLETSSDGFHVLMGQHIINTIGTISCHLGWTQTGCSPTELSYLLSCHSPKHFLHFWVVFSTETGFTLTSILCQIPYRQYKVRLAYILAAGASAATALSM